MVCLFQMGGLVSDGWFSVRNVVYFQIIGLVSDVWFSFRWLV